MCKSQLELQGFDKCEILLLTSWDGNNSVMSFLVLCSCFCFQLVRSHYYIKAKLHFGWDPECSVLPFVCDLRSVGGH